MKKTILCIFLAIVMVTFSQLLIFPAAAKGTDDTIPEMTITLNYYPQTNSAGVIWNPVANAEQYYIWFKNNEQGREDWFVQVGSVLSQSADKGCFMTLGSSFFTDSGWGGSDYQVDIEAIDRYGKTLAAGESNIITTNIEKLDTPVATFSTNGVVSWDPVPNAKSYMVLIYRSDSQFHVRADTTYQTKVDFTEHLTVGDRYLAFVTAKNGKDFRDSQRCQTDLITYQGRTVVSSFVISGITEPVAGQAPDGECKIPVNCGYRPTIPEYGYVSWYNEDGNILDPDTDTFTAGKKYSAQVTLIPNEGYEFADSGLTGSMNGKDTTKSIFIATPKKKIYMSRWFTCASEPAVYTVSGTVTSFLNDKLYTGIVISREGGYSNAVSVSGNNANFSFTNVPAGTYSVLIFKTNHVSRAYTVTVSGDTTLTAKIHPKGDINGDGKITTIDFAQCNAHAKGAKLLSGYAIDCADVIGSEKEITTIDAARINAAAKGKNPLW